MGILAACHVHSKWSYDGSWTLADLSAEFGRRGYRVVMMTEHDRGFTQQRLDEYREACIQASSEKVLVVPGIEYSDAENCVHVLVWGDVPFLGEQLATVRMLEQVRAFGGYAVLAHPSRKDAWKSFDSSWAELLSGIEIWNRKYDGWAPSKTAPSLLESYDKIPFVGLDFHTHRQFFPLGMMMELTGEITEAAILRCFSSRLCRPEVKGVAINNKGVAKVGPMLTVAEKGRKIAASILKRSRTKRGVKV